MERSVTEESGALPGPPPVRSVAAADVASPDLSRLVRALAGRVHASLPKGSGIEMSDLIQAGNLGLLQAARTFRPETGAPLAGYAKFRIRGEMLDAVRRHSGPEIPGAPVPGCPPNSQENTLETAISAPPEHSPQASLLARERAEILDQELERLPPRHRKVVRLRYKEELTLREIGALLHVNESRACQLHRSALKSLRRALRNRGVLRPEHLV